MSDSEFLYATIVILYLIECVHWAPGPAWVFRSRVGRGFSRFRLLGIPETFFGVPCLASPLPPLGDVHDAPPLPFSLSNKGILTRPPASLPGAHPPPAAQQWVPYGSLGTIEAEGALLRLGAGNPVVATGSKRLSLLLAGLVTKLKAAKEEERPALLAAFHARRIEAGPFEARLAEARARLLPLRVVQHALVAFLILIGPAIVWRYGFEKTWFVLLPLVMLLDGLAVFFFLRAHRALAPQFRGDRIGDALLIALVPPVAMRAHDRLVHDLLTEAHPALIAAILQDESDREESWAALLRELRHPRPLPAADLGPDADEALRLARDAERAAVEAVVRRHHADPARLLAVDAGRFPEGAVSRCPRCLDDFTQAQAECATCLLPAVPIEAASAPVKDR